MLTNPDVSYFLLYCRLRSLYLPLGYVRNALYGAEGVNRLLPGETVVVQGTGGVSCFGAQVSILFCYTVVCLCPNDLSETSLLSLQLAILGGANVVATSSSDEKLEILRKSLLELVPNLDSSRFHPVNYKKTPDWDKEVLKFSPAGAEHIIEVGGAGTVERSFAAVRRGGSISTIGFIGSDKDSVPPNVPMLALRKGGEWLGPKSYGS